MLPGTPQRLHRRLPGATQITHGLMGIVGNPNRRQLAGAEQRSQGRSERLFQKQHPMRGRARRVRETMKVRKLDTSKNLANSPPF